MDGTEVVRRGRRRVNGVVFIGTALVMAASAAAQCEQSKLLASDAPSQDRFGIAVGISGDAAIVGSWLDDTQGDDAGAAYMYAFDGVAWTEARKLTASDGAAGDQMGVSVAVRGDRAIVGAWLADENGEDSGAAYVFHYDGATWSQASKLLANDGAPGDQFGNAVAIDGDVALVGSVFDDDAGQSSGAAYVFRYAAGQWSQEQKLIPAAFVAGDQVGVAVALDGDVAVVSAPGTDDNGTQSGSVFVFRYNGNAWVEEQEIMPDDGRTGDFFGNDVDVTGDVIVVGAVFDDSALGIDSGSAYVFRYNGSVWQQEQKLAADDGSGGDRFGSEVAIDGDTIVAGAPQHDALGDAAGAAYTFRVTGPGPGSVWEQSSKITAADGNQTDEFGGAVAASGDRAVIGAPQDVHDGDVPDSGSAYIFVGVRGTDCNENGISDTCDIANGTSEDVEPDGIPDECQCPQDLDDSGFVDFADILHILAAWGPCEGPGRCPEDLNEDGLVGFADVLTILSLWGECKK